MALDDRLDALDYYDRDAEAFADRYDSVSFKAVHPLLAHYLPERGQILDVGAGSGRDARAMAARGLEVLAAEPSAGLRAIASARSPGVTWVDDRLPRLALVAGTRQRFDFILCSAVLMLIAPSELTQSFASLSALLAGDGRLALNLRAPRPDEPAELFFDHADARVLAAASAAGLDCIDRGEAADSIGRDGYRWRSFVFEHGA